jgi:hypothetical protein
MEQERMDLSPLDPMHDPNHWRAVFDGTLHRVDAVLRERARQRDPLEMIAGWMKPVLLAAAVLVAILIPVEIALEKREANAERIQGLVALSADWAHAQARPTGGDLLRALSEGKVR